MHKFLGGSNEEEKTRMKEDNNIAHTMSSEVKIITIAATKSILNGIQSNIGVFLTCIDITVVVYSRSEDTA